MYVFPNCSCVVRWENSRVRLNPDQQWRADDPFVLARPELFDTDPRRVSESGPSDRFDEPPVERVTAGPGERRATPPRRPVRKTAKKPPTGPGSGSEGNNPTDDQ